jgi:hypothetical protein
MELLDGSAGELFALIETLPPLQTPHLHRPHGRSHGPQQRGLERAGRSSTAEKQGRQLFAGIGDS